MAFLALCKAFREDPVDAALRARLDALAVSSDHEEELAAILEDEIDRLPPMETAQVALRLGQLNEEKLGEPARAATFLRRAMALDSELSREVLPALERLYQKLEAWPELADVLSSRAASTPPAERVQTPPPPRPALRGPAGLARPRRRGVRGGGGHRSPARPVAPSAGDALRAGRTQG